jgi:hypothetical protein
MYDNNGIAETDGVCNNNIFVYNKMINNRDVFYFHGSHTGWKFYNNVVIETSNSRLAPTSTISGESGTTTSMDIKNNVFQIGIGGNVLAINTGRISGTHTNNVYKISGGTSLGFTLNLTEVNTGTAIFNNTTDPDPVNWDYSPLLTGILLNTGTTVGYTPDFAGTPVVNPPDIGIIEHQLTPGQSFQGGTVWYVDGTGQHGLIVSPTNAWNHTAFSYGGITLNCGASSTAIGDGQANTNILLACDPSCYAATYCNNYSNSGYTDWYLPTIGDLEAMYNNGLDIAGNVPFAGSYVFSSSESIVTPPIVNLYVWDTSTNTIDNQGLKDGYGPVIPVRSF